MMCTQETSNARGPLRETTIVIDLVLAMKKCWTLWKYLGRTNQKLSDVH